MPFFPSTQKWLCLSSNKFIQTNKCLSLRPHISVLLYAYNPVCMPIRPHYNHCMVAYGASCISYLSYRIALWTLIFEMICWRLKWNFIWSCLSLNLYILQLSHTSGKCCPTFVSCGCWIVGSKKVRLELTFYTSSSFKRLRINISTSKRGLWQKISFFLS